MRRQVRAQYAADHKGAEYYNIITFHKSFHGRTLTTLAATGQDGFHHLFTPLTEGFLYADADDIEGFGKLICENKVAGVLLETIQGEKGRRQRMMSAELPQGGQAASVRRGDIIYHDRRGTGPATDPPPAPCIPISSSIFIPM